MMEQVVAIQFSAPLQPLAAAAAYKIVVMALLADQAAAAEQTA
jgi:hypothetical protein